MTASEIAEMLARNAEAVTTMLLPQSRRDGCHLCAGSIAGEAGKSLKVVVSGSKAGKWKDFAADGHSGDLLDLWALTKGIGIGEAIREARDYLGIREPLPEKRTYTKPPRPKCRPLADSGLAELTGRGISPAVIQRYKVADNGREMVFPSLRDGELIAVKYRRIGEKKFRQESGQEPCLFGWQAIPEKARSVLICEGEIDALTFATWGIPAMSVPMGGGDGNKQNWISSEYEHLARFDEVYLAMDADGQGQSAVAEIIKRLGSERCRIVDLGHKDANEAMRAGMTSEQAWEAVAAAKSLDPEGLRGAHEYTDDVLAELTDAKTDVGWSTPWPSVTERLKFRPGELIVLAGETGHGKSRLMAYLFAKLLTEGAAVCAANMEFKPRRWLRDLLMQLAGNSNPSRTFAANIMGWLEDRLWVYDPVRANPKAIMETHRYAAKRYGCTVFVVDNLSKCGIADDDYPAQKAFCDDLSEFARNFDATVFLVHHMRKGSDTSERFERGRTAIKGSGGILDMANTVLTIWRNKIKERKLEDETISDEDRAKERAKPDAILECHKQRETGDEPKVALWFDRATGQYLKAPHHRPRSLLPSATAVESAAVSDCG